MLILLSPSKTQSIQKTQPAGTRQPRFGDQARVLVSLLDNLGDRELAGILQTSSKLTAVARQRLRDFSLPHMPGSSGAALTTFTGEVFSGIQTEAYTPADFAFADAHLVILSGLYGGLRPLELIQPYRLEMAAKVPVNQENSLYRYWSRLVTEALNEALDGLAGTSERLVVNCASQEYARVVDRSELRAPMLTVGFLQRRYGTTRTIAIHAKRARGLFADYCIRHRLTGRSALAGFDCDGYRLAEADSSDSELVFVKDLG